MVLYSETTKVMKTVEELVTLENMLELVLVIRMVQMTAKTTAEALGFLQHTLVSTMVIL